MTIMLAVSPLSGTYMLDKPVDSLVYDDEGKVSGVTSGGETAKAGIVVCDPSYAEDKCKTGTCTEWRLFVR